MYIYVLCSLAYFHSISLSSSPSLSSWEWVYLLVCLLDFILVFTSTISECASVICRYLTRKMKCDRMYKYMCTCVLCMNWFDDSVFIFRWCVFVFIRTNWRRLCFVDGDIFFRSDIFSRNGSFAPEKNTRTPNNK